MQVSSQLNSTRKQLSEVSHTNDDLASKAGGYREQVPSACVYVNDACMFMGIKYIINIITVHYHHVMYV